MKARYCCCSLSRQLGSKWSAFGGADFYRLDTNYAQNESDTLSLNLGVNYSINQYLNAFGSVSRVDRSAPIEENEFYRTFRHAWPQRKLLIINLSLMMLLRFFL